MPDLFACGCQAVTTDSFESLTSLTNLEGYGFDRSVAHTHPFGIQAILDMSTRGSRTGTQTGSHRGDCWSLEPRSWSGLGGRGTCKAWCGAGGHHRKDTPGRSDLKLIPIVIVDIYVSSGSPVLTVSTRQTTNVITQQSLSIQKLSITCWNTPRRVPEFLRKGLAFEVLVGALHKVDCSRLEVPASAACLLE